MEKRANKRYRCEVPLICSYFNKDVTSQSRLLNYSIAGIQFESTSFFPEKSIIYIRMEEIQDHCLNTDGQCIPRTLSLAEVRWCKKISDEGVFRYAVGAKFL